MTPSTNALVAARYGVAPGIEGWRDERHETSAKFAEVSLWPSDQNGVTVIEGYTALPATAPHRQTLGNALFVERDQTRRVSIHAFAT